MLVDVHSHIYFKHFDKDFDEMLERAKKVGVTTIVCSGVDHESNFKVLELSKKYPIIKASLGIYPLDAVGLGYYDDVPREARQIDVDEEIKFIRKNKNNIIAIGEVGLDKSPDGDCKLKEQEEVFLKAIRLAKEINKPLVVHTRKAEKECIDLLESENAKNVVLHCFTGNLKLVKRAESLGFSFSIPAIITRLQHFQALVNKVSLQNILTETDAPYLSPIKGERSEPFYIRETIKSIAKIKNLTEQETENIIFSNFQKIFLKNN